MILHPLGMTFLVVGLTLLGAVLLYILYFNLSPMPVVRMLRKGMDAKLTYPPEFDRDNVDVQIEKDLAYPSHYRNAMFDLYMPARAKQPVPVILWVHGGAFVAGDKSGVENWGAMLAARGYAVVSMNYEWAPEARYPAQLIQINECLQYIQQLAKSRSFDMDQLFLAGDSAGAHMVAQFAALQTNESLSNELQITSSIPKGGIKGVLLFCGPYDIELMTKPKSRLMRLFLGRIGWSYLGKRNWQKSPLAKTLKVTTYVTPHYPPCYITDGNTGSFEGHGRALVKVLRENGVPVVDRFFLLDDGIVNHEYQVDLLRPEGLLAFEDTLLFLSKRSESNDRDMECPITNLGSQN
ncbi:alpha/beta hydrolase [Ferdinandcohnia quinoae]|uniref:Alpha/beta hydrolase n=1 Tax=Fredinandcohnia quinoae TaxID=2918902 RepID=A0AAW5DWF5_9BACI|nr:alpha/beta hydrolase [Fredinandcohnia sp. SECRCQ15]MCH1624358.1 alpha/beta hydrolase [Fredinandcohnia sp. SECRCQ15]